jgi:hypothetical protein
MRNLQRDIETFLIGLIVVILAIFASSYAHGALRTHSANVFNNPVSIGDSATAVTSSMLDIKSTTKGVLWPRMTSTQRAAISSPATGLLVWDSTLLEPCQYSGSAWQCFPPGSTSALGNLKVVETDSGGLLTGASSLGISLGGTGQTTANAALNALLPSQTGNANKVLQTDGSNTSWATASGGGGGLNFVGLNTSFVLGTSDDVGAENSTGNWATYADAAGTDPVDMTGGSATALTFSRTTTAGEVLDGSGSFKIVKAASNAQGMGVSVAVNIPPGYRGQNMQYTIPFHIISGSISSDDLKLSAYDVTNSALLSISCNTGSSTVANQVYTTGTVLVICNGVIPSSTAQIRIGFHFASTSTTAVTFSFDDVYVAPPSNIGQVSQATFVGSAYIGNTASCTWTHASSTPGAFGTTAACPGPTVESNPGPGVIQTTDTDLPQFTVKNLPDGNYLVRIDVNYQVGANDSLYINDGTTTTPASAADINGAWYTIFGNFSYSTSGDRTFALWSAQSTGTGTVVAYNSTFPGGSYLKFSIFRYPSISQTAMNASQVGAVWNGYFDSTCDWSRTNVAYGDPTADASCALVETKNVNFGTVTAVSGVLPGLQFTPSATGKKFRACANISITGSSSGAVIGFQLIDGNSNVLDAREMNVVSANNYTSHMICGDMDTTGGQATVKLQTKASAGNVDMGGGLTRVVSWSLLDVTNPLPSTLLVNSVTSSSAGVELLNRLEFGGNSSASTACTSSPCTIASQSGSWATTVTRTGAGAYTITAASGVFSATPVCLVNENAANMVATAGECFYKYASSSSTSLTIGCFNTNQSAGADTSVDVICMGPH